MKKITVVEDDPQMREELVEMLRKEQYMVHALTTFAHVTEDILAEMSSLVILDLNLPESSGFQICRELKQKSAIAVLVLTSRDQMKDELHALQLGADEYLTKPCRRERLLARISNLLKRYEGRENLLEGDGFLLDDITYTIYIGGESTVLPGNQGKLLAAFLRNQGEPLSRENLCITLWKTTEYIDENALQVNISRLKHTMKKLRIPYRIEAVRGQGYQLLACGEEYEKKME